MKEFIYSRNAVYETLRAKRREIFGIEIADSAQEKGKLAEIIKLASERKIKVNRVPRAWWITRMKKSWLCDWR